MKKLLFALITLIAVEKAAASGCGGNYPYEKSTRAIEKSEARDFTELVVKRYPAHQRDHAAVVATSTAVKNPAKPDDTRHILISDRMLAPEITPLGLSQAISAGNYKAEVQTERWYDDCEDVTTYMDNLVVTIKTAAGEVRMSTDYYLER